MLRSSGIRCEVLELIVAAELEVGQLSQQALTPLVHEGSFREGDQGLLNTSDRNSPLTHSSRHSIEVWKTVYKGDCRRWRDRKINWADMKVQLSR